MADGLGWVGQSGPDRGRFCTRAHARTRTYMRALTRSPTAPTHVSEWRSASPCLHISEACELNERFSANSRMTLRSYMRASSSLAAACELTKCGPHLCLCAAAADGVVSLPAMRAERGGPGAQQAHATPAHTHAHTHELRFKRARRRGR
eukprot:740413-Pleurochrysis_carterae.AAC.2